jgi:hypothetical protein
VGDSVRFHPKFVLRGGVCYRALPRILYLPVSSRSSRQCSGLGILFLVPKTSPIMNLLIVIAFSLYPIDPRSIARLSLTAGTGVAPEADWLITDCLLHMSACLIRVCETFCKRPCERNNCTVLSDIRCANPFPHIIGLWSQKFVRISWKYLTKA